MSRKYTKIEMLSDEILHRNGRSNVELRQSPLTCRNRHWKDAADRTAVPIEGEFRREKRTLHRRLRNHTVGCKETNGYRQIKPRTVLSHIGGRKVHRHPFLPQLDAGVADRCPYLLLRLLHRRIGKPHQFKARQPRRYIHLNVDNPSVNPEGRRTIGLCKQRPSLPRFKYKKIITQDTLFQKKHYNLYSIYQRYIILL